MIHLVVALLCGAALVPAPSRAVVLRTVNTTNSSVKARVHQPVTFQGYYNSVFDGFGIWKWSNALDAYQRHFTALAGKPLAFAEVGVQSGGSIAMWKSVLGQSVHYYGLDINPKCKQFNDPTTTIVIGDQADTTMWDKFFSTVTNNLDILVDDGGHQAHQMGVTFHVSFPHINPGGYIATEDIFVHDQLPFLLNAATSIGWWHGQGQVESTHLYPGVFLLKKISPTGQGSFLASLPPVSVTVDNWQAMWTAISQHPGTTVAVKNPLWGSMLTTNSMKDIFTQFEQLVVAFGQVDDPPGCATTPAPICTATIVNSGVMNSVKGVHAYQDTLYVEVNAHPPVISATRKGIKWIPYGF